MGNSNNDAPDRRWIYFWTGFDLTEIRRPDGTAWRFEYGDPRHPGHLTRMILVGTDGSERGVAGDHAGVLQVAAEHRGDDGRRS